VRIVVQSLNTRERRILVQGAATARYVSPGYLVYLQNGSLMAAPFDSGRLELTGTPVPVVEDVAELFLPVLAFHVWDGSFISPRFTRVGLARWYWWIGEDRLNPWPCLPATIWSQDFPRTVGGWLFAIAAMARYGSTTSPARHPRVLPLAGTTASRSGFPMVSEWHLPHIGLVVGPSFRSLRTARGRKSR